MNEYFLIDLFTSDGVELKEIRKKMRRKGAQEEAASRRKEGGMGPT